MCIPRRERNIVEYIYQFPFVRWARGYLGVYAGVDVKVDAGVDEAVVVAVAVGVCVYLHRHVGWDTFVLTTLRVKCVLLTPYELRLCFSVAEVCPVSCKPQHSALQHFPSKRLHGRLLLLPACCLPIPIPPCPPPCLTMVFFSDFASMPQSTAHRVYAHTYTFPLHFLLLILKVDATLSADGTTYVKKNILPAI